MEVDNPEMINDEYSEEILLNNYVPDDVQRMLCRDNMNLNSPGDVFIWFKNLHFTSQKIMLSNMINVIGDEPNAGRSKMPFHAFGNHPLSRLETKCTGGQIQMDEDSKDIPNIDGYFPRLGAPSPPHVLIRDMSQVRDDLPHKNVTIRKKN